MDDESNPTHTDPAEDYDGGFRLDDHPRKVEFDGYVFGTNCVRFWLYFDTFTFLVEYDVLKHQIVDYVPYPVDQYCMDYCYVPAPRPDQFRKLLDVAFAKVAAKL